MHGRSGKLGREWELDEAKRLTDIQDSVLCFSIRVQTGCVPAKSVLDGFGIACDGNLLDSVEFEYFQTLLLEFI